MIETQAERTLVKSPPELWAELSDPASLARHLGEFGEIRITRTEPETTVAWEGEQIRGTVELRASGWGTKVTLTVLQTTPPEPVAPAPLAAPEPPPVHDAPRLEPVAAPVPTPRAPTPPPPRPPVQDLPVAPAPAAAPMLEPVLEPAPFAENLDKTAAAPASEADAPAAELAEPPAASAPARRGFFARLWGRRQPVPAPAPAPPTPAPPAEPVALAPEAPAKIVHAALPRPAAPVPVETPAAAAPEPEAEPPWREPVALLERFTPQRPEPEPPLEPEPEPAARVDTERTEAVLSAVLDTLGAAHHRPFSRS